MKDIKIFRYTILHKKKFEDIYLINKNVLPNDILFLNLPFKKN